VKIMDKKKRAAFLKELKIINGKRDSITNEMSLTDKTNKLLSLLIRILLEKD